MRRHIGSAAVLALAGGAVAFYFHQTEVVLEEVAIPAAPEVQANPYYAASRLLERMGAAVAEEPALGQVVPAATDLVVFLTPDRQPDPSRAERVVDWVAGGGHLVVAAHPFESGAEDPLLDWFGVRPEVKAAVRPSRRERRSLRRGVHPPRAGRAERRWDVRVDRRAVLSGGEAELDWAWRDPAGAPLALSIPWGEGRVTVVTSDEPFRNDAIGEGDHAAFLWHLVTLGAPPTRALVVSSDAFPTLLQLLWHHAWATLVGLGLLVALALHAASRPFGPQTLEPDAARRGVLEQVDAVAAFLWRRGARRALLEGPRDALRARVRRRRPDLAARPEHEWAAALADEVGVDPALATRALLAVTPTRGEGFAHTVALLERLRRSL